MAKTSRWLQKQKFRFGLACQRSVSPCTYEAKKEQPKLLIRTRVISHSLFHNPVGYLRDFRQHACDAARRLRHPRPLPQPARQLRRPPRGRPRSVEGARHVQGRTRRDSVADYPQNWDLMIKRAGMGYFWLCLCTFCTAKRTQKRPRIAYSGSFVCCY